MHSTDSAQNNVTPSSNFHLVKYRLWSLRFFEMQNASLPLSPGRNTKLFEMTKPGKKTIDPSHPVLAFA
jgi:hypothetical protein